MIKNKFYSNPCKFTYKMVSQLRKVFRLGLSKMKKETLLVCSISACVIIGIFLCCIKIAKLNKWICLHWVIAVLEIQVAFWFDLGNISLFFFVKERTCSSYNQILQWHHKNKKEKNNETKIMTSNKEMK